MDKDKSIKLFEKKTIRTHWDAEAEKWYFSIVDVCGVLTESDNPQVYWRVLKKRLLDEGNETVTNCNGLKMPAKDGKMRLTDVADTEQLLRLIQSIRIFRQRVAKELIANGELKEAKDLINEYIQTKNTNDRYYDSCWNESLLEIAQKENDTEDIRRISLKFIQGAYKPVYYNIYKSTFSTEAWPAEVEKLLKQYRKVNVWHSSSVAEVLVEEKRFEELLAYLGTLNNLGILKAYPYAYGF